MLPTVPKTRRFDNIDSAVIINSVSKALLMMTAESMLSKRPVFRIAMVYIFLSYFCLTFSVAIDFSPDTSGILRKKIN